MYSEKVQNIIDAFKDKDKEIFIIDTMCVNYNKSDNVTQIYFNTESRDTIELFEYLYGIKNSVVVFDTIINFSDNYEGLSKMFTDLRELAMKNNLLIIT